MPENTKKRAFRMEQHPFFWFGQIFGLRNRLLNVDLRSYDLDYPRMKTLGVLSEVPGCSMQRLADLTAVDRTSLTHTVQLLVAQKLLRRRESPADRRSVVLDLTPAGRRMFKRIAPLILKLDDRTMAGLTAQEMEIFLNQLRRMTDNLRD
jgi:DNA-binding MarR family transcriptional regulator